MIKMVKKITEKKKICITIHSKISKENKNWHLKSNIEKKKLKDKLDTEFRKRNKIGLEILKLEKEKELSKISNKKYKLVQLQFSTYGFIIKEKTYKVPIDGIKIFEQISLFSTWVHNNHWSIWEKELKKLKDSNYEYLLIRTRLNPVAERDQYLCSYKIIKKERFLEIMKNINKIKKKNLAEDKEHFIPGNNKFSNNSPIIKECFNLHLFPRGSIGYIYRCDHRTGFAKDFSNPLTWNEALDAGFASDPEPWESNYFEYRRQRFKRDGNELGKKVK